MSEGRVQGQQITQKPGRLLQFNKNICNKTTAVYREPRYSVTG